MDIEKLIARIRQENLSSLLYGTRLVGNYIGIFGLKKRPDDIDFKETGTLEDLDIKASVDKTTKLIRKSIPGDFCVIAYPSNFAPLGDERYAIQYNYQIIDCDIYAYLMCAQAIKANKLKVVDSSYSDIFYFDGRFVDLSHYLLDHIHEHTFFLSERSCLIPYMYSRRTKGIYSGDNVEDLLFNLPKVVGAENIKDIFSLMTILSNINSNQN
jgi:hypothetical protein